MSDTRHSFMPPSDAFSRSPPRPDATPQRRLTLLGRWRHSWQTSLRFRLLALGLMPVLLAFPIVMAVLVVVGGERANALLMSNLRSNLAGSHNYLDQLRLETGARISQLANSERLIHLVDQTSSADDISQMLTTAARGSGLDYLIIASPDGTVLGSNSGAGKGSRLPDSYVIRQAMIGVANTAFERFDLPQAAVFAPGLADSAVIDLSPPPATGPPVESRVMLINAAAHLPLTINAPDAILIGGILLNKNFALIERMRNIIYPVGALPGDAEGMSALYLDDVVVAISRQRQQGQRKIGNRVDPDVAASVLQQGEPWLGKLDMGAQSHIVGFEPILDGEGQAIGMIGVGFTDTPYRREALLLLAMVSVLFALTLLAISIVFIGAGRDLSRRLTSISATVAAVRAGNQQARVNLPLPADEVGRLAQHFDVLLDTIDQQNRKQRAAQQAIAREASRRRALFEHERDGVVILNTDGSVFEANPKCAAMLGYSSEEFKQLRFSDWDTQHSPQQLQAMLQQVGPEGWLFETVHRRKDGQTYAAEVAISHVIWGDQAFTLALQRDISQRKAVELELAKHRHDLENLVQQRTKELQDRSGQLNAIFALSPDGFVSFDRAYRVNFVNHSFLRMTGLEADTLMGCTEADFTRCMMQRCLADAVFPDLADLRQQGLAARPEHQPREPSDRYRFELQGESKRVIEVGIRRAETSNVSQVLYFRDITRETEVDQLKSEFLTTAAHELRTPMASIYGYAELLLTQEFNSEMQREFTGTIHRQAELMSSIINELLDLARIEARRSKDFVLELLALDALARETVASFKVPQGRDAPLADQPDEPLMVRADRRKMQQAILNILSNAYKYSPHGGEVRLHYRLRELAGKAQVGIEVQDQGIGMTEKERSRICERFYRADTSGKIPGTGLGMSIVEEIVTLHLGEVEVASEPGVGTRVTLWLPRA